MNEELQARLITTITSALNWLESAGNFVTTQAPLVVQELFWWGIIKSSSLAVLCFTTAVVLVYWFIPKMWRISGEEREKDRQGSYHSSDYGDTCVAFFYIGWVLTAMSTGLGITASLTIVKILVAPRMYLLDVLRGLLG